MRIPLLKYLAFFTSKPMSAETHIEMNGAEGERETYPIAKLPPKLIKFQTLIGICSPNVLRPTPGFVRPAPNEGLYKRTIDGESKIKFQYNVSNYVVNVGGMLQIVVGAALTALGAANGPSGAVTVLGALNTIIAGLLTYLKGQGTPYAIRAVSSFFANFTRAHRGTGT